MQTGYSATPEKYLIEINNKIKQERFEVCSYIDKKIWLYKAADKGYMFVKRSLYLTMHHGLDPVSLFFRREGRFVDLYNNDPSYP